MPQDPEIEQAVRKALTQFENFCVSQIIAAWFADAPDPASLVDEMLGKWEASTRSRYERAAKQRTEATGVISVDDQWLDEVLAEANKRIRASLAKSIGDQSIVSQPTCVRPGHACDLDPQGCVLEPQRSRKLN